MNDIDARINLSECWFRSLALNYFEVDDNRQIFLDQGTECPDLGQAKKEAIHTLMEMIRESLPGAKNHVRSALGHLFKPAIGAFFHIHQVTLLRTRTGRLRVSRAISAQS
ncbi:DUF6894 family protein [Mesorhizobium australicum]|uniref:DUF6894 family protein n=1 Tax=Mesorhizobium australicum TaxID=536018 RepID=UPI003EBC5A95